MTYVRTLSEEDAVQELGLRGVADPEQLMRFASPEAIVGACRWFDSLHGAPGKGVLVNAIKAGGRPGFKPQRARSVLDEQQAYGEQIVAWLREHFPQWNREEGNRTHTAAIAEVIRLHHRYGKGSLRASVHGALIRAAVARFEQEQEQEQEQGAPGAATHTEEGQP